MDLRAFFTTKPLVFLFFCWGSVKADDLKPQNDTPPVPYEIKFVDITFQLTDVTRYLVQTELKNIQADKNSLHHQLDKFNLFLPVVEPILKEKAIPEDFKFLMIYNKYQSSIETSTLLENSVYWCLDREKADDVDLIVNESFDERKHLVAATKGAAMCFMRNQVLYRNWGATLFSHIADKKILTLLEVNKKWAENSYILLDSPAYSAILQFLAYKIAIEREFPVHKPSVQQVVYEYPYGKGKTLNKIALDLQVEPATLSEFNKWLGSAKVPDSDCKVLVIVPLNRYSEVRTFAELSRKTGLPAKDLGFPILIRDEKLEKEKKKGGSFYLINGLEGLQAGMCDVPVTMAYKAGISVERFIGYNDMKINDLLKIGQVYYIQQKSSKASVPFHVVREGETLWDISQLYGVRLVNLLSFNRFETIQRLQRGRVIWLQMTRPKNKPIEYIEMPDEMAEVEDIAIIEPAKNTEKEFNLKDSVEVSKKIPLDEINQQIKREQPQLIVDKNKTESLKKESTEEITVKSVPLTQAIKKIDSTNANLSRNIDNERVVDKTKKNEPVIVDKQITNKNEGNSVDGREENKNFQKHIVKKGETLFRISVNYNVAVSELWVWNNLTSTIIKAGTTLKIKK